MSPDQPAGNIDVVGIARARRQEIARLRGSLDREDAELQAFLATADALARRLAPPTTAAAPGDAGPRRVGKAEVIEIARILFREGKGKSITTGQVTQRLAGEGYQFTGESSPSSVVSAYLGQANDIVRNPEGAGWLPRRGSWIDQELEKLISKT